MRTHHRLDQFVHDRVQSRWQRLLVLLLLYLSMAACVNAETLIYFDENGGNGNPRGLYNFDTETGLSTLRTTVAGDERFFAMAIRQSDHQVFAVSLDSELYTININTGAPTLIA